jgi:hypothetical protein
MFKKKSVDYIWGRSDSRAGMIERIWRASRYFIGTYFESQ